MNDIVLAEFNSELQKLGEYWERNPGNVQGTQGRQVRISPDRAKQGSGALGIVGARTPPTKGGAPFRPGNKPMSLIQKNLLNAKAAAKRMALRKVANINFARSLGGHALMGAGVGGAAGAGVGASQGGVGGAVRGGLVGAGLGAAGGVGIGRAHAGNLRNARRGKMVTQRATKDTAERLGGGDSALERAKTLLKKDKVRGKAETAAKGSLEGTEDYDRLYQPFWSE